MNCKFIFWNLPKQIKDKLDITLSYNCFNIPAEINTALRTLEQTKPNCYALSFEPGYEVKWFTILTDLEKVCDVKTCIE